MRFEKHSDLLEQALLAGRFEVERDVRFRQKLRDLVHRLGSVVDGIRRGRLGAPLGPDAIIRRATV
jgi:hypothetical protein